MTPDDIRNATFDSVRRGADPEQVRDLLARVAFLLERRPDLGDLPDAEAGPVFDLDDVGDIPGIVTGPDVAPLEPAAITVDHRALAEQLDTVIAAASELVRWKDQLDAAAQDHDRLRGRPGDATPWDEAPARIPIPIGLDDLHERWTARHGQDRVHAR